MQNVYQKVESRGARPSLRRSDHAHAHAEAHRDADPEPKAHAYPGAHCDGGTVMTADTLIATGAIAIVSLLVIALIVRGEIDRQRGRFPLDGHDCDCCDPETGTHDPMTVHEEAR